MYDTFGKRTDMRKIENVQFRCLKYIYNDFTSTYGEFEKEAERPVMYVQRLRAIHIEVYKAYFNIRPKYICNIFKEANHVYSTRNNMLVQSKCLSFNNGIHSSSYEGSRLWNLLEPRFKEINSVNNFKVAMRT